MIQIWMLLAYPKNEQDDLSRGRTQSAETIGRKI